MAADPITAGISLAFLLIREGTKLIDQYQAANEVTPERLAAAREERRMEESETQAIVNASKARLAGGG